MVKQLEVDILSRRVMRERRTVEETIEELHQLDPVVGLGALEHSLLMLERLKKELVAKAPFYPATNKT